MTHATRLLLVEDDAHDRALAALVLTHAFGEGAVVEAADALAFAEQLAAGGFDAAVVSSSLNWGSGVEALRVIRRRHPDRPALLFAAPGGSVEQSLAGGLAGVVRKDSAGFLALPRRVRRALEGPAEAEVSRHLAEALPIGVVVASVAGSISYANPAAVRLLGASVEAELVGSPLESLFADPELARRVVSAAETAQGLEDVDARVASLAGQTRRVVVNAWRDLDPGSGQQYLVVVLQDAARAREAARALARRNESLEELASAVSHDFLGVIRLVHEYARLLQDRHRGRLDQESDRYLDHLLSSAGRLEGMAEGVLEYLRSDQGELAIAPADFNAVLEEALANLAPVIESSGAVVQHGSLPTLAADRRQMVRLFQNLIDNAIKFRGEAPPELLIDAKEGELEWEFAISDKGIGIDPKSRERIFGMFQRLRLREDQPGAGMGLALCKRIVKRHGGEIRVEPRPGGGTTFLFTLLKSSRPRGMR